VQSDPAAHTPPPGAVPTVAPLSTEETAARSTPDSNGAPAAPAAEVVNGTAVGPAAAGPDETLGPPPDAAETPHADAADVLAPLPAAIAAEVASAEPELHALLTAPSPPEGGVALRPGPGPGSVDVLLFSPRPDAMPARLPGSAFLVAPPPASRAVEQAQSKALTDWGHPPPPPPAALESPPPALREPLFGGAAVMPLGPAPGESDELEPAAPVLFAAHVPTRSRRWLAGAVALVAAIALGVWLLAPRGDPPAPAPEPTAVVPPQAEPAPIAVVAATEPASTASEPGPTLPVLAGSPQQDAPSVEEPGEADYRAAVQAAREANAASRWELEAKEYRRALAVRPASLEAKEGLGSAIVKSSGRAGSYLEAERLLADVVRADAARARAWLVLGMARQLGARPGPAVEAYKRYLALAPQGPFSSDVRAVVRELDRGVAQRRPGR